MKHKVGTYSIFIQKKGVEEIAGQKIRDGVVFYTVWTEPHGGFDTTSQAEAIILSEIIKLKLKLNKIEKMINAIDKC